MYENTTNEYLNDEDLFFNRIVASCNRLLKILRAHSTSIDSLEKKMNKMTRTTLDSEKGDMSSRK